MVCCFFLVLILTVTKRGGKLCSMSHTDREKDNLCAIFWPKYCGEAQKRMSFMR